MICEVCKNNEGIGVASVPGVPYSAAYCRECLQADAHPLGIVVCNTAMCGGLNECAPWWIEIVEHTLSHLKISKEDFNKMVAKDEAEINSIGC
jgi:hypothetical protein